MGVGLGAALGGFLQGGAEGFKSGIKIQQEADKAKREQEAHQSAMDNAKQQREATGLQIETNRLALNKQKDEEKARMQTKAGFEELANMAQGGVSGVVMDGQGNAIGEKRFFGDDASIQEQMRQHGVEFMPGSIKKIAPMDEMTKYRAMADIVNKARADNNLMDTAQIEHIIENNRKYKAEGIEEGIRHFLSTGNSDQALAIFDKQGGMKSEKGTFLRRIESPDGMPDVGVYKPGKDGHPELVTTMQQYMIGTSSGWLQNYFLEKIKQEGANKRNKDSIEGGHQDALTHAAATIASAKLSHAGQATPKDRVKERIDSSVGEILKAQAQAVGNSIDTNAYVKYSNSVKARALQIMEQGWTNPKDKKVYAISDEAQAVSLALDEPQIQKLAPQSLLTTGK